MSTMWAGEVLGPGTVGPSLLIGSEILPFYGFYLKLWNKGSVSINLTVIHKL